MASQELITAKTKKFYSKTTLNKEPNDLNHQKVHNQSLDNIEQIQCQDQIKDFTILESGRNQ